MDVLSDILERIKLSSAVYFKSDFSAPWGMEIPSGPYAQFHIVTRGQCALRANGKVIDLFAGDLVVFPRGAGHWLADNPKSEKRGGMEVVQSIWNGRSLFEGDNISTTLVCGHFEFDKNIDHPILSELPDIILITDAERQDASWLKNITNLIIQEAGRDRLGSNLIVTKLGEVLFVHVMRAYILRCKAEKGFLAAIQDERIGRVLEAMHQSPSDDWQLNTLARIAGMSRTGFSNKFKSLIGETPLVYITNWRILQAKEMLSSSKKSVGEIAGAVGYQSEAAFNRLFKKRVLQTPLKYRQALAVP